MSPPDRCVLCLVHPADGELRAVSSALSDVQAGGGSLILATVHDPAEEEALGLRLSDASFVGLKLTEEVERLAARHAVDQLQEHLARAERLALEANIPVETRAETGPLCETLQRLVAMLSPAQAHLPRLPQGFKDRILRGNATDLLRRALSCPTKIVE